MQVLLRSVPVVDGQTSPLASLQDEPWKSVSTTPYSAAGHAETYVPAASKMWALLQSMHVLDAQASQLASLQDEP